MRERGTERGVGEGGEGEWRGGRGKAKREEGVEGILKSIHIARGVQTEKASAFTAFLLLLGGDGGLNPSSGSLSRRPHPLGIACPPPGSEVRLPPRLLTLVDLIVSSACLPLCRPMIFKFDLIAFCVDCPLLTLFCVLAMRFNSHCLDKIPHKTMAPHKRAGLLTYRATCLPHAFRPCTSWKKCPAEAPGLKPLHHPAQLKLLPAAPQPPGASPAHPLPQLPASPAPQPPHPPTRPTHPYPPIPASPITPPPGTPRFIAPARLATQHVDTLTAYPIPFSPNLLPLLPPILTSPSTHPVLKASASLVG